MEVAFVSEEVRNLNVLGRGGMFLTLGYPCPLKAGERGCKSVVTVNCYKIVTNR
jgi:hypothetical protein